MNGPNTFPIAGASCVSGASYNGWEEEVLRRSLSRFFAGTDHHRAAVCQGRYGSDATGGAPALRGVRCSLRAQGVVVGVDAQGAQAGGHLLGAEAPLVRRRAHLPAGASTRGHPFKLAKVPPNKALVPTVRLCRAAPGTAPRGTAPGRWAGGRRARLGVVQDWASCRTGPRAGLMGGDAALRAASPPAAQRQAGGRLPHVHDEGRDEPARAARPAPRASPSRGAQGPLSAASGAECEESVAGGSGGRGDVGSRRPVHSPAGQRSPHHGSRDTAHANVDTWTPAQ